jgi:PAS domain S-box-containing protein
MNNCNHRNNQELTDTGLLRREKNALENQLRRIFETVESGLLVLDQELNILTANKNACEIMGCVEDEIGHPPVSAFFGKEYADIEWMLAAVLRTGQTRKTSICLKRGDNKSKHISLTVAILNELDENIRLLVCLNDISEYYESLVQKAQTEKMAAVGLLAAGIAHEFNNIWASVHGYAELAKQNDKFAAELVDVTLEQSERASEIIHSLLSFSDMRVDLRRGVRIGRILKSIQRLVELEMRAKGIEMKLHIAEDPKIIGNESMLQQVFLNLVINAYQSIEDKGTVSISLKADNSSVYIAISDTGCGMTPDQMTHIFEPFYTTKGALGGNERVDGHGLGLTLSYNLITVHSGEISVDSKPGAGSVFTVRIPLELEEEEFLIRKEPLAAKYAETAGLRILVVDDEIMLHGLIRSMLPQHTVDAVAKASQALEMIDNECYDAIFLDLILGSEMDGFQLFAVLQEKKLQDKVILITGRPEDKRINSIRQKAAAFITKPFSMDDIRNSVNLAAGVR